MRSHPLALVLPSPVPPSPCSNLISVSLASVVSVPLACRRGRERLGFGEGIPPPDDIEAYKWLTLAIKGYTDKNQDRLVQARKDLATLAKRMSPAQISEAERRAKAFKPTP